LIGGKKDKATGDSLSERSDQDHLYALKSIILDRVSPVFIEELLNEGMYHVSCFTRLPPFFCLWYLTF
jgi:hypothetical protein